MSTSSNALNRAKSGGYTLIELAIVLVIIGALLAPAIAIYLNYEKKKDIDTTVASIDQTLTAIGGYRALYGRYPCPAPANAAPGDAAYGHEDCTIAGVASLRTGGAYGDILIGSVPFKTMNLQESEVVDGYHSRLTYAVTENLTVPATFSMGGGGITIQDKAGQSLVTPQDGGHFIVVSHGEHSDGAVSKQGVAVGTCGSALTNEQENCDGDTVFTVGELDLTYDDRAGYFSSVQPAEWQIQETDPNNIHLRTTSNLAVGVSTTEDMTTKENAAIRSNGISDAGGVTANTDHIEGSQICTGDETGTNDDCFPPSLITADSAANGATIRCPAGQVMVGVREKQAICEDEITVSCPSGQFMTGLDSDGHVLCDDSLPVCGAETVTTMCGESRNLPDTPSGETQLTYSGQCHMITARDSTYFQTTFSGLTQLQMAAHVLTLNAAGRTATDCGPTASNALVRETYACDEGGEWDKVAAHERRHYYSTFPSDVRSTGTSRDAEHNIAYGLLVDPNNNWDNHDCWCREDYRVNFENCPSGMTGTRPVVRKHTCPQTSHSNWEVVYVGLEGCGCSPSQQVSHQSCVSYYNDNNNPDISWGALTGYVALTHDYVCVGGVPTRVDPPVNVDISDCACPANSRTINRTYCATGFTNSFDFEGVEQTGVSGIFTREWVCPGGTGPGGMPVPGYWDLEVSFGGIPACTCDSSRTDVYVRACPNGMEGSGIQYRREYDCVNNQWEPEADWELLENNCHSCTWKEPSGTPSNSEYKLGGASRQVGATCACGTEPAPLCWDYGGSPDPYNVWTNCQCVVQNN